MANDTTLYERAREFVQEKNKHVAGQFFENDNDVAAGLAEFVLREKNTASISPTSKTEGVVQWEYIEKWIAVLTPVELNKLGKDGWELCGDLTHNGSSRVYYFKRPINTLK